MRITRNTVFPLYLCDSPLGVFHGPLHYNASPDGSVDAWKVDSLAHLPQRLCLVFPAHLHRYTLCANNPFFTNILYTF